MIDQPASQDAAAAALRPRRTARIVALSALGLLVVLAVFLSTRIGTDPSPEADVRGVSPTIQVETLSGDAVTNAQTQGKVVYVNFWNTWCIPCQQEEPVLAEFFDAHSGDPDFEMLAIVHDDSRRAVEEWVAENPDAGYDVVFDPKAATALQFGVTGQPESYTLTPDGQISCVFKGPATRQVLEAMLRAARAGAACGDPES